MFWNLKSRYLDQQGKIEALLKEYKMDEANAVLIPMEIGQPPSIEMRPKTQEEIREMEKTPYRAAIAGALLFIAMTTRPDICYPVNLMSRYCENPGPTHWKMVKRIFRYLRGNKLILIFGEVESPLEGFSDADWAGDVDNRKNTTGYVFTMNGGAISWGCKKQNTVALSTTEAECMAAVATIQEGIWIRELINELLGPRPTTVIYVDNKGAIATMKNNAYSPRTKHMDIKNKFIKEKIDAGIIKIEYKPTQEMAADILTKPVTKTTLLQHLPKMGINNEILD